MITFPPDIKAFRNRERNTPKSAGETVPNVSSPGKHLLWWCKYQWVNIALALIIAAIWMLPEALYPYCIGKAIDEGIVASNNLALAKWILIMAVLLAITMFAVSYSAWFSLKNWLVSSFGIMKFVSRKSSQLGHVLPRRTPTGEVISVSSSDPNVIGEFMESMPHAISNLIMVVLVAYLVMTQSLRLGIAVLIATPIIIIVAYPVFKPLEVAQRRERSRSSVLTGQVTDIVAGLRILRGVGGEKTFASNYNNQSQRVCQAGRITGFWAAMMQTLSVLTTGLLLVVLTWLGVNELLAGRLTVGQLVSFFGYATFLVRPIRSTFATINRYTNAKVAARRIITVLNLESPWVEPENPKPWPGEGQIVDRESGVVIEPGKLTVLVSKNPEETAALASKISRYLPVATAQPETISLYEDIKGRKAKREKYVEMDNRIAAQQKLDADLGAKPWGVEVCGVDLNQIPLQQVRDHIFLLTPKDMVFAGNLREIIDPKNANGYREAEKSLVAASATDIYRLLPNGWASHIDERGRDLSGGQRQRLMLARALLVDPEVLVLVDPTSAVDAHTESEIAEGIKKLRSGKTTVITSISPLWIAKSDRVVFVEDAKAVASGSHQELLDSYETYRAVIDRDLDGDSYATN